MKTLHGMLALAMAGASLALQAGGVPSPADAEVYIVSPEDGALVEPTFTVVFGLKGMGVAPAGVDKPGTGHHHLVIDAPPPAPGKPMGGEVRHFGAGQTQTQVTLTPGTHTLQLVLGDMNHVPHSPPVMSKVITVTVKGGVPAAPGGLRVQ